MKTLNDNWKDFVEKCINTNPNEELDISTVKHIFYAGAASAVHCIGEGTTNKNLAIEIRDTNNEMKMENIINLLLKNK